MKRRMQILFWSLMAVGLLVVGTNAALTAAQTKKPAAKAEWLPLCGKCTNPTVFSKSGIGTAHAVAEAKVTFKDAKGNCEAYAMSPNPDCDKQAKESLKEEKGKVYKATADCVHGKMTDANGENFVYAGLWPAKDLQRWNSFMKGKTRWRWGPGSDEDTGKIVGFDGPTRAPMVDATSKILCPNGVGANRRHR